MPENRGKFLAELRRSNAAGIHDHRPSRSQLRQLAIRESEEDMSFADEDYLDSDALNVWETGPTDDEIFEMEDGESLYEDAPEDFDAYPYSFSSEYE